MRLFFRVVFKILFLTFWIFMLAYVIGFIVFVDYLPTYKPGEFDVANHGKIDAIVVLTGGSERIPEGLKMLQDNRADLLFISGLYTERSLEHYKKNLSQFKNLQSGKIHFDTVATTTIDNAEQVRNWAIENNIKSIYLVTSYYHIPRAEFLIKQYAPDLRIVSNPVFPVNYDTGGSIETARIFSLIFFEYNKYILSNIFITLGLI